MRKLAKVVAVSALLAAPFVAASAADAQVVVGSYPYACGYYYG